MFNKHLSVPSYQVPDSAASSISIQYIDIDVCNHELENACLYLLTAALISESEIGKTGLSLSIKHS